MKQVPLLSKSRKVRGALGGTRCHLVPRLRHKLIPVYLGVLLLALLLPASAQTGKRQAKPARKAPPAKLSAPPIVLTEEDRAAAERGRITTHELKRHLDAKTPLVILDNRDGKAWIGSAVKIPGALHIPLSQLVDKLDELPKDKEIVTYCT